MTRYGYVRVSTEEQSYDLQERAVMAAGVVKSNLYREKISGVSAIGKRQSLDHLLSQLKAGDEVIIWKLDRLGRSLPDLIALAEDFDKKGVNLVSLTEGVNTTTPAGKLFFNVVGALAQFERDLISERVTAGMAAAKAEGRHVGRKPSLDRAKVDAAFRLYESGQSAEQIGSVLGVSYKTVQRALKTRYEANSAVVSTI